MGPVFVRLLPVLLKGAQAQMQLTLPTTTPGDGFLQFLSLVRRLGLLAVILLSMGLIAGERRGGTLAVLFVKPVSRMAYVWSRRLTSGALIGVASVVGSAVAVLSTLLLGSTPSGDPGHLDRAQRLLRAPGLLPGPSSSPPWPRGPVWRPASPFYRSSSSPLWAPSGSRSASGGRTGRRPEARRPSAA